MKRYYAWVKDKLDGGIYRTVVHAESLAGAYKAVLRLEDCSLMDIFGIGTEKQQPKTIKEG